MPSGLGCYMGIKNSLSGTLATVLLAVITWNHPHPEHVSPTLVRIRILWAVSYPVREISGVLDLPASSLL
jgi:hypothetical protein